MKSWYLSKTLWLNSIAAIALLIQTRYGFIIDAEIQAALLTLVNAALRLVTRQPLNWKAPGDDDRPHLMPPTSPSGSAGYVRRNLIIGMCGLIVIITCFIMLSGCARTGGVTPPLHPGVNDSPQVLAGKSLLAVKGSIEVSAKTTNSLCKIGKISKDKCIQAKTAYEMSKPSYDAALDAYLLMATGGDPAAFGVAMTRLLDSSTTLLHVIGEGGEK